MMKAEMRTGACASTLLCVDNYREEVPQGSLYPPGAERGEQFRSLTQCLLKMEGILSSRLSFQPPAATRSFGPPPEERASPAHRAGKLATFSIQILFRQNASWQGCVTWVEAERSERFRSVLELVLLMDGALRETQAAALLAEG